MGIFPPEAHRSHLIVVAWFSPQLRKTRFTTLGGGKTPGARCSHLIVVAWFSPQFRKTRFTTLGGGKTPWGAPLSSDCCGLV